MTSSSTKPAKFYHKVHKDLHRVAQRKNIKKNQDGFSLRFFNSKGAGGFNPCTVTDFSIAKVLLAPEMTNIAISRKGAKDLLYLQHAKTAMTFTDFKYKKQICFSLKNAEWH